MPARRGVGPGGVGGEFDGDGRNEVQVARIAVGAGGGVADRAEEHVGGLGHEGVAQPAVGEFACQRQVGRAHGRDVDGHVGGPHHRHQRRAAAVRQWKRVDLTVVHQSLAPADGPHDLDGLPGGLHRLAEPDAVPALHHPGAGRADAEDEPAAGQFLQAQRRRGQQGRTA